MNQDFTGLVAIVTGGASGIGAAIAERLRNGGARVAVFDLRPDTAPQADLAVAVDVAEDAKCARASNASSRSSGASTSS